MADRRKNPNNTASNESEYSSKRKRIETQRDYGAREKNFNSFFDTNADAELVSTRTESSVCQNVLEDHSTENHELLLAKSPDILSGESYGSKDILRMIAEMTETIRFLAEKINSMSKRMEEMRNHTTLRIDSENIGDEDLPQFNIFETFKLPIEDNQQLERLENCLKNDKSFNIFFVSSKSKF